MGSHESGHVVEQYALTKDQQTELKRLYDERKKGTGPWLNPVNYTSSSTGEYFAQSTNALSAAPAFAQSRVSGSRAVHVGSVDTMGNPGSNLYDWGLRDFQSIAIDRCGMAHPAWTDDNGAGETVTAGQLGGPSLVPTTRC